MMKIEGSGSASGSDSGSGSISQSQRHLSADLDPDQHQNVMDPQHCFNPVLRIQIQDLVLFRPMDSRLEKYKSEIRKNVLWMWIRIQQRWNLQKLSNKHRFLPFKKTFVPSFVPCFLPFPYWQYIFNVKIPLSGIVKSEQDLDLDQDPHGFALVWVTGSGSGYTLR